MDVKGHDWWLVVHGRLWLILIAVTWFDVVSTLFVGKKIRERELEDVSQVL